MHADTIFTTLLTAAAFLKRPLQDVVSQSLKDAYGATKAYLREKFGDRSDAAKALELATAKPESLMRKALLAEESAAFALENDAELAQLITHLANLLPSLPDGSRQNVHVEGRGNKVQVAGGDIIHTEKVVHRSAITPDDRHITILQRDRIREVAAELGRRLTGGAPGGIAAVHRMLQRHFEVASYLLIPRDRYEEAMSFLRQQRAMHRSRLRHYDPVAYRNDLFRAIFAGARELGWDGDRVYRFAEENLSLKNRLIALKDLGPIQLKTVADAVQRAVRTKRSECDPDGASQPS